VRIGSEADDVTSLAELVEENLVRGDSRGLKRVMANLNRSLNYQADLVLVASFGVAHGKLRDSGRWRPVNVLSTRVWLTARCSVIATFQHSSLSEAIASP